MSFRFDMIRCLVTYLTIIIFQSYFLGACLFPFSQHIYKKQKRRFFQYRREWMGLADTKYHTWNKRL